MHPLPLQYYVLRTSLPSPPLLFVLLPVGIWSSVFHLVSTRPSTPISTLSNPLQQISHTDIDLIVQFGRLLTFRPSDQIISHEVRNCSTPPHCPRAFNRVVKRPI